MTTPDLVNIVADLERIAGELEGLRQCFDGQTEIEARMAYKLACAGEYIAEVRALCDQTETKP